VAGSREHGNVLRVPQKTWNLSSGWATISFSKTLLYVVSYNMFTYAMKNPFIPLKCRCSIFNGSMWWNPFKSLKVYSRARRFVIGQAWMSWTHILYAKINRSPSLCPPTACGLHFKIPCTLKYPFRKLTFWHYNTCSNYLSRVWRQRTTFYMCSRHT